jgi:hypothetical protein
MIREPEALGCTFSSAFTRETNEYHLSGMATPSVLEAMLDNLCMTPFRYRTFLLCFKTLFNNSFLSFCVETICDC